MSPALAIPDHDLTPLLAAARGFQGGAWQRARLAALLGPAGATLKQPETVCVVAGQQPALGGGPLYTLIKAAHAVALAGRLRAAGQPAVAVFWCASEDHDLGEAGHADLVEDDGNCQRLAHALGGGRASMHHRPASGGWTPLIAALARRWPAGLGAAWLGGQAPLPGEGLGAWHCRLLAALFPGQLACIEASQLRPFWGEAMRTALAAWPAAALEAQRRQLLAAGGPDPFGELPEAPVFDDAPQERRRLTAAEALALSGSAPLRLSPGAALRPVLQQIALPAACFIAGPGELAYHQVLGPVYDALQARAPQLVPRMHASILPAGVARSLQAWGVEPQAVRADSLAPAIAAGEDQDALLELDRQIARWQQRAEGRPHLHGRLPLLDRARGALARALMQEAQQARSLPPFACLRAVLFPRGQPQERVVSLAQVVWRHGPQIAARLVAAAQRPQAGPPAILTAD